MTKIYHIDFYDSHGEVESWGKFETLDQIIAEANGRIFRISDVTEENMEENPYHEVSVNLFFSVRADCEQAAIDIVNGELQALAEQGILSDVFVTGWDNPSIVKE